MFVYKALTVFFAFVIVTVAQAMVLDVAAPEITKPNAETVWKIGKVETVAWDTSNLPSKITNPDGQLVLGHEENDSLNLDLDHPLAQGFKLKDGSVKVTVPNVPHRDDYIVVLVGDSGNKSPAFKITS